MNLSIEQFRVLTRVVRVSGLRLAAANQVCEVSVEAHNLFAARMASYSRSMIGPASHQN